MNVSANVSFEEILANYEPLIKKQMVSLRIYKDFDEFFQLGCIALWEAYVNFDPTKGSFSTYAISTIRGKYMTLLTKKTKDEERQVLIGDERFDFLPSSWTLSPLEQESVEAYMIGLTKRERVWVYEAILLGKKTSEIAADYHVSTATVRQWKQGALRKMRKNVGGGL